MKKIAVVLFVFVTVGLASCSKSDDNNLSDANNPSNNNNLSDPNNPSNNNNLSVSIVGKWQIVQYGVQENGEGEIVWYDVFSESDCQASMAEF